MRTIDAFAMHFGKKITAHGIGTQATGPAHFQPQTRQADGHIGFGAGCALVESLRLLDRSWLIGHEHHHGFAECRSEEHTSELQSLMRISYAVFCLKKKKTHTYTQLTI